jgi:hypothetical protein
MRVLLYHIIFHTRSLSHTHTLHTHVQVRGAHEKLHKQSQSLDSKRKKIAEKRKIMEMESAEVCRV